MSIFHRYAANAIVNKRRNGGFRPNSVYAMWKPCRLGELYRFFAIIFHMCIVKKPQLKDYWSQHTVLHSTFAARLMTRDRFMAILTFLHLVDNRLDNGSDNLFKIRPFVDVLGRRFKECYYPERAVAVDESICPFRGRIKFRVYIPNKPNKWGIKIYALCESQSGYMWNFEIYDANPAISNKPSDVVLCLTEPLRGKSHVVYTDNYYTCPRLADDLYAEDLMSVGVVRLNRHEMPAELKKNMTKGEVIYRRRDNVLALRWKDKRDVCVLTTIHGPEKRLVRSASQCKEKPIAIQDYIQNMAGVDKSDQVCIYILLF